MTSAEYFEWASRYGATFGLSSDGDAATFAAWFDVFAASGYTAAELSAATASIAQHPPRFRNEHLAAIHAAVRDQRAARRRAMRDPAECDDRGTCAACGDSGGVAVPHPKAVAAGQWVEGLEGTTACVACSCGRGRAWVDAWDCLPAETKKRVPQPMGLGHYEDRVARHWRSMLAAVEAKRAAHRKAAAVSRAADQERGPLAAPVRQVLRLAGGG